ncbi:MAG: hypothetical protein LUQ03_01205, partial [Methanomicrobiales archaeon]|nr:hypothetical protein [Methanomicrobiales archaeon]
MHCRYCSNWNFYDAKFCAYCGRELAAQDFLLTKFIITYYALFVVLGVFAALAIYWIQISKQIISLNNALIIDQNYPIYQSAFGKLSIFDLGIAGCLLLVGLIGLAIVWKLLGEFEED